MRVSSRGFTIIELLIAISVIGLLIGITAFAFEGSRKNGRDNKRQSDLQFILAGMEEFRSHCGGYLSNDYYYKLFSPETNPQYPKLTGDDSIANAPGSGYQTCLSSNTFMDEVPQDPLDPDRIYRYNRVTAGGVQQKGYVICAALENLPNPTMDVSRCGSQRCGNHDCNYIVESPFQLP